MGFLQKLLGRDGTDLPPLGYSNAAVIARIEKEHGVDTATAKAWFGEMLIFLDLCARSDEMLSPPPDVDAAWHAFLLHSRDYEAYCNERYGRVIHHQPTGEPDPAAYRRAYEHRRDYASSHEPRSDAWALPVSGASAAGWQPRGADLRRPARRVQNADGFGGETSGDCGGSASDSGRPAETRRVERAAVAAHRVGVEETDALLIDPRSLRRARGSNPWCSAPLWRGSGKSVLYGS